MMQYDVAIIGGGIVGLAAGYKLTQQRPDTSIVVLEKESDVAMHQTGRNSGVIHSGIYYTPGSMKARNCREGKQALVEFCERESIAYDMCGKVIVAVSEEERAGLQRIFERGQQNEIECELIGPERLRHFEPHTAGIEAIHVPNAGIVDYRGVAKRLAAILEERGHDVLKNAEVTTMTDDGASMILETKRGSVAAGQVVACAGLYADHVARMSGQDPGMAVIPFRGEYYQLRPEARHLCNNLIYPVPDPAFPFLGVHFTRMVDGRVECGPNAVLAFAREGYDFGTVDPSELAEVLMYSGFRKLARRHWKKELYEIWRSLSKRAFLTTLQRLIPAVQMEDLQDAPSGVRAQTVLPNGDLSDDFVIKEASRVLNVCNAPSPAATASLQVGEEIVRRLLPRLTR